MKVEKIKTIVFGIKKFSVGTQIRLWLSTVGEMNLQEVKSSSDVIRLAYLYDVLVIAFSYNTHNHNKRTTNIIDV